MEDEREVTIISLTAKVTGFGLASKLGRSFEVTETSGVSLRLFANSLLILPVVQRLVGEEFNLGGANANRVILRAKCVLIAT